jgi:hypothetical protein
MQREVQHVRTEFYVPYFRFMLATIIIMRIALLYCHLFYVEVVYGPLGWDTVEGSCAMEDRRTMPKEGENLLNHQRADGDTEERYEGRNTEAGKG